jgi:hypothetical protein
MNFYLVAILLQMKQTFTDSPIDIHSLQYCDIFAFQIRRKKIDLCLSLCVSMNTRRPV